MTTKHVEYAPCMNCGDHVPLALLDAKPARLAGPATRPGMTPDERTLALKTRAQELEDALWADEDFDRLECRKCYGPGWEEGVQ